MTHSPTLPAALDDDLESVLASSFETGKYVCTSAKSMIWETFLPQRSVSTSARGGGKPWIERTICSSGCSILTRTLLPSLLVHEMTDMKMISTSMVDVSRKDNCRNLSPANFAGQSGMIGQKTSKSWKVNNTMSSNSSPMKACQGFKSSHVSGNIMVRLHSLEHSCISG
jgi:hypothetical protein